MAKKAYRKMTPEERAAQLERQRFIDDVIEAAAQRAGIENTPEERRHHVERVLASVADRAGIENTSESRRRFSEGVLENIRRRR